MSARSRKTPRRPSRRALKRSRIARAIVWTAGTLLVLGAFVAGFFWRSERVPRVMLGEAVFKSGYEQQTEALRLFDEAVRARHEGREQSAMNSLIDARRADPALRGVDVLVAEIALDRKDLEALRSATKEALRRGENESSANLLNALSAWMRRDEQGTDKAGSLAQQFLNDSVRAEPSSAAAYFFRGELGRFLGDGRLAYRYLLAALHRQQPWRSAELLRNKMHFASGESSDRRSAPIAGAPPTESAEAALALRAAVQSNTDPTKAIDELSRTTSALHLKNLLADSALQSARETITFEALPGQAKDRTLRPEPLSSGPVD